MPSLQPCLQTNLLCYKSFRFVEQILKILHRVEIFSTVAILNYYNIDPMLVYWLSHSLYLCSNSPSSGLLPFVLCSPGPHISGRVSLASMLVAVTASPKEHHSQFFRIPATPPHPHNSTVFLTITSLVCLGTKTNR